MTCRTKPVKPPLLCAVSTLGLPASLGFRSIDSSADEGRERQQHTTHAPKIEGFSSKTTVMCFSYSKTSRAAPKGTRVAFEPYLPPIPENVKNIKKNHIILFPLSLDIRFHRAHLLTLSYSHPHPTLEGAQPKQGKFDAGGRDLLDRVAKQQRRTLIFHPLEPRNVQNTALRTAERGLVRQA